MSTQSPTTTSIPFSLTTPLQPLRLFELPHDLLDLIAQNPSQPLRLTSFLSPSPSAAQQPLHLCADDKVWAVRQVSTSNCVYVVGRCNTTLEEDEMELDDYGDGQYRYGLTAIARVGSVLELVPVQPSLAEVEECVKDLVSPYPPTSINSNTKYPTALTITSLQTHIPAPTPLLHHALDRLAIFEHAGTAYHPTPTALLQTWTRIAETCALEGIRLDGPFAFERVIAAMSAAEDEDEDEDMYGSPASSTNKTSASSAYAAIALTLFTRTLPRTNLIASTSSTTSSSSTDTTMALHPQPTTAYIGSLLRQTSPSPSQSEFQPDLTKWRSLIPERWWGFCVDDAVVEATGAKTKPSNGTADAGTGKKKMGKWHEKFAAKREAARSL